MVREIQIHVEEPSMEAFLDALLPRLLPLGVLWRPINYGSKQQLLERLPQRLAGYANYDPAYRLKVLILVDRDADDCVALKSRLEAMCLESGLASKTRPAAGGAFDVVNRIVIEELEAWFFGDPDALQAAWPGTGRTARRAAYREPDAVKGGTHEAMLRMLKASGHLRDADRLPKIEVARTMGGILIPERNRSSSFQHFWTGLNALVAVA